MTANETTRMTTLIRTSFYLKLWDQPIRYTMKYNQSVNFSANEIIGNLAVKNV